MAYRTLVSRCPFPLLSMCYHRLLMLYFIGPMSELERLCFFYQITVVIFFCCYFYLCVCLIVHYFYTLNMSVSNTHARWRSASPSLVFSLLHYQCCRNCWFNLPIPKHACFYVSFMSNWLTFQFSQARLPAFVSSFVIWSFPFYQYLYGSMSCLLRSFK